MLFDTHHHSAFLNDHANRYRPRCNNYSLLEHAVIRRPCNSRTPHWHGTSDLHRSDRTLDAQTRFAHLLTRILFSVPIQQLHSSGLSQPSFLRYHFILTVYGSVPACISCYLVCREHNSNDDDHGHGHRYQRSSSRYGGITTQALPSATLTLLYPRFLCSHRVYYENSHSL